MKPKDEHLRSYVDDIAMYGLLQFLTWEGSDISPSWKGAFQPATRSNDAELASLALWNRSHYLYYLALVKKYVEKRGAVLDVGCGVGSRTLMLQRYAERVAGIDSDMLKLAVGAQLNRDPRIEWIVGDFLPTGAAWPESQFDYVFCVEVIEHIIPQLQEAFMRGMHRQVKPGGALLLTTPRDEEPERSEPHVGLWDDPLAERQVGKLGGTIEYFNVRQLEDGGEDPWCDKNDSTHYVVVVKK